MILIEELRKKHRKSFSVKLRGMKILMNFAVKNIIGLKGFMRKGLKMKRQVQVFLCSFIGFIKLQDITKCMNLPCVMDIKIGIRGENLGKEEKDLLTTSGVLKFRICGLSVMQAKSNNLVFRDKFWGRHIKKKCINKALALFFFDGIK